MAATPAATQAARHAAGDGVARRATPPGLLIGVAAGTAADALAAAPRLAELCKGSAASALLSAAEPLEGGAAALGALEAAAGVPLVSGALYWVPPGLIVEGGRFAASPLRRGELRMAGAALLRSLARECGARSVGLALGAGASGLASALRALRSAGGLALADAAAAAAEGLCAGAALDRVLPLAEMAAPLETFAELAADDWGAVRAEELVVALHASRDFDASRYERGRLRERGARRMALLGMRDSGRYAERLCADDAEASALARELTAGPPEFFRDPQALVALRSLVVEPWLKAAAPGQVLRAWVPACAGGEEAYSVALLLLDAIAEHGGDVKLELLATDRDEDALSAARDGLYPGVGPEAAAAASAAGCRTPFATGGERIAPELREALGFRVHELSTPAPLARLDLICARGALHGLTPASAEQVLARLHGALADGGALLLDRGDSAGGQRGLFSVASRRWRIYRRRAAPVGRAQGGASAAWRARPSAAQPGAALPAAPAAAAAGLAEQARSAILDARVPPAIVVAEDGSIVFTHGDTASYLRAGKETPLHVSSIMRADLVGALRSALEQCRRDRQTVSLWAPLDVGRLFRTRLTASPLPQLGPKAVLLTFEEEPIALGLAEAASLPGETEQVHDELWSFFASTRVCALLVDEALGLQQFTPAAAELLGIGPRDRGRALCQLSPELLGSGIIEEARGVLADLAPSYRELRTQGGWVARRILPYRTDSRRIEGLVVVLTDVSELRGEAQSLAIRERRQTVLARLGLRALEEENFQKFMDQTVIELQQALDADCCALLELQSGGTEMLLRAGCGWDEWLDGQLIGVELDSHAGFALRSHAPVLVEDLAIDKRFAGSSALIQKGVRSGVTCPIWGSDGAYGVIGVHCRQPRAFNQDDASFLQGVAAVISDAVKHHLSRQRLGLEVAVARALSESRCLESGVRAVHTAFATEIGTEVGELWWLDTSGQWLERTLISAEPGLIEAPQGPGRFRIGDGMVGRVFETSRAEWVSAADSARFARASEARALGFVAGFAFPVQAGSESLGVMTVFSTHRLVGERPLLRSLEGIGRSIGEFVQRIETESRLREGEARKAVILDSSLDAVITMDARGRILDFNEAAEAMFGYAKDEARGRPMADLIIPPALRERYRQGLARSVETDEASFVGRRLELQALHREGWEFPVEVAITRISESSGPVFTGFIRDLSEHKRAEAAVRSSEVRFRQIFENVGVAVWEEDLSRVKQVLDELERQGVRDFERYFAEHADVVERLIGMVRLLDVNHEALRMFGAASKRELIESRSKVLLPETSRAFVGTFLAMREGRDFFTSETPIGTLRGDRLDVVFSARFPRGSLERVLVSTMDITPLKRAQAQLAESQRWLNRLTEATPDAVIVYDVLEDSAVYASPRLREVLGYTPDELIGMGRDLLAQLVYPEDRGPVRHFFRNFANSDPDSVQELTCRVLHRDGEPRWVQSRLVLFKLSSAGAGVRHALMVARDVSELKRAEMELQEASRQKDEFIAMLGHELRNPLSAVCGAAEQLKLLAVADPRVGRTQEILERQTRHMARLLDGLLDVSRVVLGKIVLDRTPFDLARTLRNVVHDREHRIASGGLELTLELPPEEFWVDGDSVRLTQIVDNLLSNAAQYTEPPGSITVSLRGEGGFAVLCVSDNGQGIEASLLPHIFEPFRQAKQSLDRSKGGLGLGLALVKSLAEMHGGSVLARSDGTGCGSRFEVRVPLTDARPAQSTGAAQLAVRRVLIVEDDEDVAEMLRAVLEAKGHAVLTAANGAEGLRMARQERPAVVLCDLGLPDGMTGFDVAREMRSDPLLRDTHLIALTGYGRLQDRARSEEAGFDAHMTKPVDIEVIVRAISSARPARRGS